MSVGDLTNELQQLFNKPGGPPELNPSDRAECRRITLQLIMLCHANDNEATEYERTRDIMMVSSQLIQNISFIFEEAPRDYFQSMLLALAPLLSNANLAESLQKSSNGSSIEADGADGDASSEISSLNHPAQLMGHIAFKLLRIKDVYAFRAFAADAVTLFGDSMDATSLLLTHDGDTDPMDDAATALLAFNSLRRIDQAGNPTNGVEISISSIERTSTLLLSSLQLLKYFLERDCPILVDLIENAWAPVITLIRRFSSSLAAPVVAEAVRVLCLLARYAACPSVQEDYLTGAILSLLENLCDPSCDTLLKLVCSVLFSSLSNFELREESLSERAISLIDRCQTVISGLNLSGSDSQETTKLAIGCLELLGSCAQASPSCCIKVANVALSCLASRKLLERVVDVLVTAVSSDSPPKPRQSSNPYEAPSAKRTRLNVRSSSMNQISENTTSPLVNSQNIPFQSKLLSNLLRVGNDLQFDQTAAVNLRRTGELRTITNVILRMKDWQALQELAPTTQRLLDHVNVALEEQTKAGKGISASPVTLELATEALHLCENWLSSNHSTTIMPSFLASLVKLLKTIYCAKDCADLWHSESDTVITLFDFALSVANWLPLGEHRGERQRWMVESLADGRLPVIRAALRHFSFFLQRNGPKIYFDMLNTLKTLGTRLGDSISKELMDAVGNTACLFSQAPQDPIDSFVVERVSAEQALICAPYCQLCRQRESLAALAPPSPVPVHKFAQPIDTSIINYPSAPAGALYHNHCTFYLFLANGAEVGRSFMRAFGRLVQHAHLSTEECLIHLKTINATFWESRQDDAKRNSSLSAILSLFRRPELSGETQLLYRRNLYTNLKPIADVLRNPGSPQSNRLLALQACNSFACFADDEGFDLFLQTILEILVDNSVDLRGASLAAIYGICDIKNMNLKELVVSRKDNIVYHLVLTLKSSPLLDTVTALMETTPTKFLQENLEAILPRLVHSCQRDVVAEVAARLGHTPKSLVTSHLNIILPFCFLEGLNKEVSSYLQDSVESDLVNELVQFNVPIVKLLAFHLGDAKKDVAAKAMYTLEKSSTYLVAREIQDRKKALQEILNKSFLELLDDFYRLKLSSARTDLNVKKQAIRALGQVINLLEPLHLRSFYIKIIAILKAVMSSSDLREEACAVWLILLKRVDHGVFDSQLLSDLVVHFTSYLEDSEQCIVPLFYYLFVEAKSHFEKYYQDIPFMPDKPDSLESCIRAYNSAVKSSRDPKEQLISQLSRLSRVITHENATVRVAALERLLKLLRSDPSIVQRLITTESMEDSLRWIVTCAVNGSTDTHTPARVLFAELLGEIGAIDPTRLDKTSSSVGRETNISVLLNPISESAELKVCSEIVIKHLIRFFKSASTPNNQDIAGHAIQEVLHSQFCYDVTQGERDTRTEDQRTRASKFWSAIVTEDKLLLEPFRSSKFFSSADPADKIRNTPLSVCLYKPQARYESWIGDLVIRLILCLNDVSFYKGVIGVARQDRDLCQSVLPHLVLKVLYTGTKEAKESLRVEFVAVLSDSESRELNQQATERVFAVFDYLNVFIEKTITEERKAAAPARATDARRVQTPPSVSAPVSLFVESLQHVLLCQAALRQKNYTRALQHFETMARAGNQDASEWLLSNPDHVKLLQKIYVGLEEPDLLSGIASIQQRSSLEDKLLQYEAAGRWVDSLNAVDQSLQMPNNDPETSRSRHIYRLKCLINLNLYDSALSLVKAELADKIHYNEQHAAILRGVGVDAARRLGKWPVVDEFLKQGCQSGFDLSIAQTLLALQKRDEVMFKKSLQACRIEQMSKLSATVSESYARSYPIVARLHMLSEMDKSWALVLDPSNKPAISDMLQLWENRSQVLQPSFSICEPVLSLRMSICDIFQISGAEVDKTWMKIAQIARVDKKFQLSQYALMRIKNQESATTRVERAQLEMDSGHLSDAISEVSRVLEKIETLEDVMTCIGRLSHESDCEHNFFPPNDPQERQAWGQAIMFTLKSIDASGDASRVLTLLHALTTSMKAFGEGHLAMARFLDRYTSETSKQNFDFTRKISGVMASVILAKTLQYYVNALEHGSQFIYQVGPRLTTLWLDFTEKAHLMAKEGKENVFLVEQAEIKRIMNDAVDTLPAGMWYTVLPQLISRVTHPDQTTWGILQRIIAEKLLENYPRHVPWHLIAWSKGNQQRMDRYKALRSFVNGRAKHTSPQFSRILDQAEKLGEFLLDVAMYDVEEKNTVKPPAGKWIISLKYIMGQLNAGKRGTVPKRRAMLPARPEDFPFDLVVPVESELFHLPLTESLKLENTSNSITIKGFGDEVEVMKSMVKPRRIEMIGSNGITYSFLAKPKDDLRKDARVTDFNNVVNYLLKQDPEGRRRQLVIRTYGVIVLNTECGLLSWVPNTHAMRHLTSDQYEAIGRPIKWISNQFKRDFYDRDKKSEDIWRALIKKYCKPSRFWRWFVLSFPDPNSWYRARMAFTRTAAVMSMVGHILGLGDRHGENILIDGRTGDCVHVDLNCVFHKGQTFTVPERVPFRLTHNMVDAMGVTGYNGTFRAVSELTMSVLRKNKETLLSVLNTLLHDPLLDWSAKAKGNELVNPEAIGNAALAAVGDRLDGIKRDNTTKADLLLPMSVESLVDSLIRDATSDTNLKDMYLGWMAYI